MGAPSGELIMNTCVFTIEYYDLREVKQPVITAYNTTHFAVIFTIDIQQVNCTILYHCL